MVPHAGVPPRGHCPIGVCILCVFSRAVSYFYWFFPKPFLALGSFLISCEELYWIPTRPPVAVAVVVSVVPKGTFVQVYTHIHMHVSNVGFQQTPFRENPQPICNIICMLSRGMHIVCDAFQICLPTFPTCRFRPYRYTVHAHICFPLYKRICAYPPAALISPGIQDPQGCQSSKVPQVATDIQDSERQEVILYYTYY